MITDYSPIDTRKSFTLIEAATFWAEELAITKDNKAKVQLCYTALEEAAREGALKVQLPALPAPSYVHNWVMDWGQPNAPMPMGAHYAPNCRQSTVEWGELARWFESQGLRPPFLFLDQRAGVVAPATAASPKTGRPPHDHPCIDSILRNNPGITTKDAQREYEKQKGRSTSEDTIRRRKKHLQKSR